MVCDAAVVSFYDDQNCQTFKESINIWDNTCHPGISGYQSFIITTPSSDHTQCVEAYSQDTCSHTTITTLNTNTGICYTATDEDGGSNAMGSFSDIVCAGI